MATKSIAFNTEPHTANVGPHTLLFTPEVYGDEFLDAYGRLQDVQKAVNDGEKLADMGGQKLRHLYREMRGFLARLMVTESAEIFSRHVVTGPAGESIGTFVDHEEAAKAADEVEGATVEDKSLRLPDRVLVELMEWVVELYGGNGGSRPTGSSNASAGRSAKGGTSGRAASRSRASIPAGGA